MKSDDHYRRMESEAIEPIRVMEMLADREALPRRAAVLIVLAEKHILRAGEKSGEDWRKEIAKAENYLHRALTGEWMP